MILSHSCDQFPFFVGLLQNYFYQTKQWITTVYRGLFVVCWLTASNHNIFGKQICFVVYLWKAYSELRGGTGHWRRKKTTTNQFYAEICKKNDFQEQIVQSGLAPTDHIAALMHSVFKLLFSESFNFYKNFIKKYF